MATTDGVLALVHAPGGAFVLGTVLAMALSRSRLTADWRGRGEAAVVLPVLALATAGVGVLLLAVPVVGAVAYTLVLSGSVWLRRFGPTAQRIGGMVALPFVTLLVGAGIAPGVGILGVALISLLSLAAAVLARIVMGGSPEPVPVAPTRESSLHPIPSTRMAIQLAVALAASFVVGFLAFGDHWGWVVLTAYLVTSGNRGRADVLLKSGLRVVGALAGTAVVAIVAGRIVVEGPWLVVVAVAMLGIGLVLRSASYAWWALVMTVVLSLVQDALTDVEFDGWARVLAILVGAVLGVLSSWFVLPVRSLGVLRRRLADLLAVLADGDDGHAALARLDEVAPPFLALRRCRRWGDPARWVLAAREIVATMPPGAPSADVRRSLGAARLALRDRGDLGAALRRVLESY